MYFTPLMGFRVDHATMIDVLAHKLLGGLGTKSVRLQKQTTNNEEVGVEGYGGRCSVQNSYIITNVTSQIKRWKSV